MIAVPAEALRGILRYGCLYAYTYVSMYIRIYVCMYVCVYVYTYRYLAVWLPALAAPVKREKAKISKKSSFYSDFI